MDGERFRSVQGVRVPTFLYGTAWKEERTEELTRLALEAGFCGVDTANQRRHYVEAGVGAVVRSGLRARDDLFLQTKFTYARGQDHRLPYDAEADYATQVRQSFESSLEHLGTEHLDAYLLHGPFQGRGWSAPDREVWREMERIQREGRVRLLGASNVDVDQLEALCREAAVAPAFVQNRCYASAGWDEEVRRFCGAQGIVYQGFSLLTANVRELRNPAFARIVARVGKTPAQVVFRFALQVGMLPLTGTTQRRHMVEDLGVYGFTLPDADVETIARIATG